MDEQRMDLRQVAPEVIPPLMKLEKYTHTVVDERLLDLVKLRASMLNGCTFCVDMHSRDALAAGESSRRLFGLAAWSESPFYTEQERAALALTDAVTRIGDAGVSDEVWRDVTKHFTEEQTAALLVAIATINVWNRFGVGLRLQPPEAG